MTQDEDAAITYRPDDVDYVGDAALEAARRQLLKREGVRGVGLTKTSAGDDAIVVYVEDRTALSGLPGTIGGLRVVSEVTGEIRAL